MNQNSGNSKSVNRRKFLMNSMAAMGAGAVASTGVVNAMGNKPLEAASPLQDKKLPWRVGPVAYGFEYSIALFQK
jgi:hypothetical protein